MTTKIDPRIKAILREGFKPWGIVIPNPKDAPKGSGLFQFRKGREEASAVVAPNGRVVRMMKGDKIS
jgi:hypothetical protein